MEAVLRFLEYRVVNVGHGANALALTPETVMQPDDIVAIGDRIEDLL